MQITAEKVDVGSVVMFHGSTLVNRKHVPWEAKLRLDHALHEGSAARPFVATRLEDGQQLVLKLCDGPVDDTRRLLVETAVGSGHDHPNLLRVFAYGKVGETHAIVAEYIQGKDLYSFLEERVEPLPFPLFHLICVGVLRGIAALHRRRIVHRDLKPENVMLQIDETGVIVRVVIVDFGIARRVSSEMRLTKPGMTLGTLAFMAPEQFHGASETGAPADIWAFCILMLRLLGSPHPFGIAYTAGFESLAYLAGAYLHPEERCNIAIPPIYEPDVVQRLTALATWNLKHNPDRRMSASDLLQCFGSLTEPTAPRSGVISRPSHEVATPQPEADRARTLPSGPPPPPDSFGLRVVKPKAFVSVPVVSSSRPSRTTIVIIILLALVVALLSVIVILLMVSAPFWG